MQGFVPFNRFLQKCQAISTALNVM
jgi:hypothetical protein